MSKTVVLLSGGIDSLVLAETERNAGRLVGVVFVDYGHPAQVAEGWKAFEYHGHTKTPLKVVHVFGLDLGAMQKATGASVVPSRNLMLLAAASNAGVALGADKILIGATSDDAVDYPDCRLESLEATSEAFQLMGGLKVEAPLGHLSKREIVEMAKALGLKASDAYSCYRPGPIPCGECFSCKQAAEAWSLSGDAEYWTRERIEIL